jgi:hypothetical protein
MTLLFGIWEERTAPGRASRTSTWMLAEARMLASVLG